MNRSLIIIRTKVGLPIQLMSNDQTILPGVLLRPIGWVFSTNVDRILDDGAWVSIAVVLISPKGALKYDIILIFARNPYSSITQ